MTETLLGNEIKTDWPLGRTSEIVESELLMMKYGDDDFSPA